MDDQEILLALSEARTAYLEAAANDDTEDTELRSKSQEVVDLEKRLQSYIKEQRAKKKEAKEPVQGSSDKELPPVELRNYLAAAIEGRSVAGAERELLEEVKLSSYDGIIPFEALLPRNIEHRADASTKVAAAAISSNQQSILSRVFNRTVGTFLGVAMPMVARGDATYPVLTGGNAAAVAAQGLAHDATKATFVGKEVKPTRISARYVLAVEDMARLEGLEDTLRNDLTMALGVALDNEIINGDGSGAHFTGIVKEFGNIADDDAEADYPDYQAAIAAGVDGKYASSMSDVRLAIGTATFSHALTKTQAARGENAYEYLTQVGGGIMVTAQLPGVASKNQLYIRTSMGSDAGVNPKHKCPLLSKAQLFA